MADYIRSVALNVIGNIKLKPQTKHPKKNIDTEKAQSGAAAGVCFKSCMEDYMENQFHKGLEFLG